MGPFITTAVRTSNPTNKAANTQRSLAYRLLYTHKLNTTERNHLHLKPTILSLYMFVIMLAVTSELVVLNE
jgi:hypothetical protein